jgi:hypothetical protein
MENKQMDGHVKTLIEKASTARTGDEAVRYSQAACNAANALRVLAEMPKL